MQYPRIGQAFLRCQSKIMPNPRSAISPFHLGEDRLDVHDKGRVAEPPMGLVRADIRSMTQSVPMITAGLTYKTRQWTMNGQVPRCRSIKAYLTATSSQNTPPLLRMSRSVRTRDNSVLSCVISI